MPSSPLDIFFGTRGPRSGRPAMIVGESWGADEARQKLPFVGQTGAIFEDMLTDSGYPMESFFITNTVPEQPPGNNMERFFYPTKDPNRGPCIRGLYPMPNVQAGLTALYKQVALIKPRVILAAGNYALWAFGNYHSIGTKDGRKIPTGIMNWRGSQVYTDIPEIENVPLLPIIHPSMVNYEFAWRQLIVNDIRMRLGLALHGMWEDPIQRDFEVPAPDNAERVLWQIGKWQDTADQTGRLELAVDLETWRGRIDCFGIADSKSYAMCIPFIRRLPGDGAENYWKEEDFVTICKSLRQLLSRPGLFCIGQNFQYDIQYIMRQIMVRPHTSMDTMLAHHVCWPTTRKSLDILSSMYCQFHRYWKEEGRKWKDTDDPMVKWRYNCRDCVATFEVAEVLREVIQSFGLDAQFAEQMEQFELSLDMITRGIAVDKKARFDLQMELADTMREIGNWLEGILPDSLRPGTLYPVTKTASPWYTSTAQQQKIFYEGLGITPKYHRKTGSRTLDAEALQRVARLLPILRPVVNAIEAYRSGIALNKFLSAPLDPDGRLRCSYGRTYSFRWTSSENAFGRGTNLQNITEGDKA